MSERTSELDGDASDVHMESESVYIPLDCIPYEVIVLNTRICCVHFCLQTQQNQYSFESKVWRKPEWQYRDSGGYYTRGHHHV